MASSEISEAAKDIMLAHLDRLLASREFPKTICPSEVARSLTPKELEETPFAHWRDMMPEIRAIVWAKRQQGQVEVLQRGEPLLAEGLALDDIKGPIRVRNVKVS